MPALCVVDIQPAYEKYLGFKPYEFCRYLNSYKGKVLFLYNGPDFGYESEGEIIEWLLENGLNEKTLKKITFYEKNYGFFRDWIDMQPPFEYNDDPDFKALITYMFVNNVNDSREVPENFFKSERLTDFLHSSSFVYIPGCTDILRVFSNSYLLCGGGVDECLLEVQLLLSALNKRYTTFNKFTY